MKSLVRLLAALVVTAAASPAFAQDAPPTPVGQAPFTGFRAEALAGWDRLQAGHGDGGSSDGVVYGSQIGYDAQFRGVVVGVEGEITGSTIDTRTDNLLSAGDRLRIDAGRDLYAGARLGYLVGDKTLVDQIDKVRPPYNVSTLNAEVGLFALEHAEVFFEQAAVLRRERGALIEALKAIPGVHPYPSEANMVLTRVPNARAVFEGMKRHGVLVKNVSALHPLLADCLRLTVGTPDENRQMMVAFKAALIEAEAVRP